MDKRFNSLLWALILWIGTTHQCIGQVSICDKEQSRHPIDIKVSHVRDSLRMTGIDTIIVYRHWLARNSYNGYGKVIWADKGQCFQYKFEIENGNKNEVIKQSNAFKLSSDTLVSFFFDNHIDSVISNPTKQGASMSHDAEHFVEVSYKNNSYCYLISGLLVLFNPENIRVKFVRMLSDERDYDISIQSEGIQPSPKGKMRKIR